MQRLMTTMLLALVSLTMSPSFGKAQTASSDRLAVRIDSLQRRVNELERRLAALESPTRTEVARNRAAGGDPKDIANWRRLREGMSYEQVRELLGEPGRINGGGLAFWYFPNGGEVTFMSGLVTEWREPGR